MCPCMKGQLPGESIGSGTEQRLKLVTAAGAQAGGRAAGGCIIPAAVRGHGVPYDWPQP